MFGIGGTAAEIAAHIFADLIWVVGVPLLHAGYGRHDLPRGTIAALEAVIVDKGLLHRMQLPILLQALDGRDLLALDGNRERKA